ncbi:hypothetical protein H0H93_016957 [Arthromyces matolae]|nr:hypothetical protein H0H93_016957 [Arthromyces matolae]
MVFISRHTSIPVPKVYWAFTHKGCAYIAMERIDGHMLAQGWAERSELSKAHILDQLKTMIEQLRSIPPPPGMLGVSNVNGGPIYDQRLPTESFWGPFPTIHDFHLELRNHIESKDVHDDTAFPRLRELISFHDQPWPQPVFTHGDLSSLNILVRGDNVVGIIDWETAGWMPPYWEYTMAWNVNFKNLFWREEVGRFLTPLPYELEMENVRRKYFGAY